MALNRSMMQQMIKTETKRLADKQRLLSSRIGNPERQAMRRSVSKFILMAINGTNSVGS